MCKIRIQYLRLIMFTLTSYFECCRLLGEFLLPPSNILPHTYWDLSAIIKDIGMKYKGIEACPHDHVIYYGQYTSEIEWPQCHTSRYQIDQVTKNESHKVLHHIPIIPCLQWLLRWKIMAQFMDYHAWNKSEDVSI